MIEERAMIIGNEMDSIEDKYVAAADRVIEWEDKENSAAGSLLGETCVCF